MALLERLRRTIYPEKHTTGAKMRKIRWKKNLSAKDVGNACGVLDMAVRNYETGERTPKDYKLKEIADFMGVDVAALQDRKINSGVDVMHILFEMEEDYGVKPMTMPEYPYVCVASQNGAINEALKLWLKKREQWENQEISDDEYTDWKNAFPAGCED